MMDVKGCVNEAIEMMQRAYSQMQNQMDKFTDLHDKLAIKATYLEFSGQLFLSLLQSIPEAHLIVIRDSMIKQLFEVRPSRD